MQMLCSMARPCKCGLGTERLFGLLGAADGESGSPAGFLALGGIDLPPASPLITLRDTRRFEEMPGSPAGFLALGGIDLPPASPLITLRDTRRFEEIQGGVPQLGLMQKERERLRL